MPSNQVAPTPNIRNNNNNNEEQHKSSPTLPFIIVSMIILCVGLLVVIMKGAKHQEQMEQSKIFDRLAISTDKLSHLSSLPTPKVPARLSPPENLLSSSSEFENASTPVSISTTTEVPKPWLKFRLSTNVVPLHYDLQLHPNLTTGQFTGQVTIRVHVKKATKHIILHSFRLNITHTKLTKLGEELELPIMDSFPHQMHEFWIVLTKEDLTDNSHYQLQFGFQGSLLDNIVGFYRSSYVNSLTGEVRYLATSKFQPTYARRAFPCFDEPNFKATFSISLIHTSDMLALSNMPVEESLPLKDQPQLIITRFQKSVPMVTYLACFIVCDFNFTRIFTRKGLEFRIYSRPDQIHKTKYALDIGSRILDYYEDYFNLSYPLPKQDLIAIPDFPSGAMEHWGLITFKESNLLYDERESSPRNKQRVAEVVAHELAHMWFGNLVTMKWWDDLWLNEGFASYVEYKGVNEVEPEWDMDDQFLIQDLQGVLSKDSSRSSRPIVQAVSHADEITESFDSISYSKGASILRMLESFIGAEAFRTGVSNFLRKYAFKNAQTKDLWNELSKVSKNGFNIEAIMTTWTNQMGYPCVNVWSDPFNSSLVYAKQHRFLKSRRTIPHESLQKPGSTWSIPLTYVTSGHQTGVVWITDSKDTLLNVPMMPGGWVKYNANQTGFYIVNYEKRDWDHIVQRLLHDHQVFGASDRSNFIYDSFTLAEAGIIPYDIPLTMSLYLKSERHLIPWKTSSTAFNSISQLLEFSEVNPLLRGYIKKLTSDIYKQLGWEKSDNHLDNLLRSTIIHLSCSSGNQDCLKEASVQLHKWMQGDELSTSLRPLVYRYGMTESGREDHWNFMWNRYLVESSAQERRNLLYGLAHIREPWLIHRYLKSAMDETKVRRQDFFQVLSYIAGNPVGRSLVWKFLRDEWTYLVKRFSLNDRYLGRIVYTICSHFTSEFELQEIYSFFNRYPEAGAGKRSREQVIEAVRTNIRWVRRYEHQILEWLKTEGYRPWFDPRLPHSIEPLSYDILLQPNITLSEFHGRVAIHFRYKESTNLLILHSYKLLVSDISLTHHVDHHRIHIKQAFTYEPNEYLIIETNSTLQAGEEYRLEMEFKGSLQGYDSGFYKKNYIDGVTGEKRSLVVSQFHPSSARTAFPCFDEPRFKAVFDMRIHHDAGLNALSNMPEKEIDIRSDGIKITKFQTSVPMITSMVGIFVSDFEQFHAYTDGGTKFRVFASQGKMNQTKYAMDTGIKLLGFYEKFFDIRYPLPKQDLIAIPDFNLIAEENWGLIIFREEYMLYDEQEESVYDQMKIAMILANELSQMWFGNLVTMPWWSELWMHESFASFMEYKALGSVMPDWNMEDQFLMDIMGHALELDASHFSYPVYRTIQQPPDFSDQLAYKKGACLLRMLEFFITKELFRDGVSHFLKSHHHRHADTADFWRMMSSLTSESLAIEAIMESWTQQEGFPYVTIRRDPAEPVTYIAQQHRFLVDDSYESDLGSQSESAWTIPLSYRTSEDEEVKLVWIENKEPVAFSVSLQAPASSWIKFNVDRKGFYLINYEDEDWAQFVELLLKSPNDLSAADRASLLGDAFLLAKAGHISYQVPLDLTQYLPQERSLVPWHTAKMALRYIFELLKESTEGHELIQKYIDTLTHDLMANLTWEDTGDTLEKKLRIHILDFSCSNGNADCLEKASKLFNKWMEGENIPVNLRSLVYRYGTIHSGNASTWDFMWNRFINHEYSISERRRLLIGLAYSKDKELLLRLINSITNLKLVRTDDYFFALRLMTDNQYGRPIVWRHLKENWDSMLKRYFSHQQHLHKIVKLVTSYFDTEEHLQEVVRFLNTKFRKERLKSQVLGIISQNIRWLEKYKRDVIDWLRSKLSSTSVVL